MPKKSKRITGVVLAGGRARRMGGGDKCLLLLNSQPLLKFVIDRAKPQVDQLVLNVNGEPSRFNDFGFPLVSDSVPGFAGPLAGVLAGLDWSAKHTPESQWVVTFASDTPFFPFNMVERFLDVVSEQEFGLACASSNHRPHPVFGIWPVKLREELRYALVHENIRRIDEWTTRYTLSEVSFDGSGIDPFFNINKPEDLELAVRYAS